VSDTETKTVRAKILRDFTDAGTERSYTAGDIIEVSEGVFGNYEAARLVEAAPAETPAETPVEGDTAKSGRTRG